MTGLEWLQYMQQGEQQEPNALQKALGLAGTATKIGSLAFPALAPFNIGFAGGGVVPDPRALLELLGGAGPMLADEPRPEPQPFVQAKHPGWEATAAVLGDVLSKLPAPRQTASSNKTIGAYMPALGAGLSGIAGRARADRAAQNEGIAAQNQAAEAAWQTGAREMSRRRWELARERMKAADGGAAPETTVDIPGVGRVPATSGIGGDYLRSTGKVPMPKSAAAEAREVAKQDEDALAEQLARDIADFRTEPNISMSGRSAQFGARVRNRVNQILRDEGKPYDFDQLTRLARQQAAFQGNTANSQRFSQLRQSAQTVRQHLDQFEQFFRKYERRVSPKDVRLIGRGLFGAAKAGFLGADAAADATALEVTGEALGKEIAVVLRGGFAPFEQDIRDADSMVAGYLGPKSNRARLNALRGLLKARIKNAVEATPFAGGDRNPYLLEPSPLEGWDSGGETPASGGWKPPGAREVK